MQSELLCVPMVGNPGIDPGPLALQASARTCYANSPYYSITPKSSPLTFTISCLGITNLPFSSRCGGKLIVLYSIYEYTLILDLYRTNGPQLVYANLNISLIQSPLVLKSPQDFFSLKRFLLFHSLLIGIFLP